MSLTNPILSFESVNNFKRSDYMRKILDPASSTGLPKAKWGLGNSRAREKRERGMMGTSVEREPFVPAFLNN